MSDTTKVIYVTVEFNNKTFSFNDVLFKGDNNV